MAAATRDRVDASVAVNVAALQLATSMKQKLGRLNADSSHTRVRHTIFRVPADVRCSDPAAYNPKIISIGPYHHNQAHLQAFQDIKWVYLNDLLDRSTEHNKLEIYLDAIFACEDKARQCYSDEVGLGTDEFVELLVLDGCFILELFVKRYLGQKIRAPLAASKRNLPLVQHDLLLLENQIPFFVLEALFNKTTIPRPQLDNNGSSSFTLMDLALDFISRDVQAGEDPSRHPKILHLLHLSYLCNLQGLEQVNSNTSSSLGIETIFSLSIIGELFRKFIPFLFFGLFYIMSSIFNCKRPRCFSKKTSSRYPRNIPTVTELREAGVQFRRKKSHKSYMDVSFTNGKMEMPLMSIQLDTNSSFRNLLAFEQCGPGKASTFTSYVVFMDNIVNTAEDVATLRRNDILESKLGSDEEVAEFFNKLSACAYLDFQKHHFKELFRDVNAYCQQDHNMWRARFVHNYLSNPWAIASLIAAILLLVLTALQTVYTMIDHYTPQSSN